MTVLMPGLGVPGSSAANMTYTLKPSLEPYGQVAYLEYPDTGLNARTFLKTAEGLQNFLHENEVHNVSFICHSAGGPNMNRVLRAPVEGWGFLGAGIGQPRILGEAWRYWEDAGISIDNVTYVSSPPTGAFIKGDAQQEFSKAVGVLPDSVLHAGVAEKFIGNVINNHTLGYDHFEHEGDRWAASVRSALDNYSARDWLTQLKVLQSMTAEDYRGVLSPNTSIAVIRPTNPDNDTVVLTARLREAWAYAHGRPVESVRDYQSPVIGHANIYQQHVAFADIFQRLYGSLYPPAVR